MSSPETIGPYRLLQPLRKGGVSRVYKGVGPAGALAGVKGISTRLLASPSPSPQAGALVSRFHREVRAVVPLSHPNILQVLETGEDGDRLYLATELFAGVSLERLLKERRLAVPQSIAVLRAICRGLAFAHARGCVHRHLSPRHVLVSPDLAAVKIADFGPSAIDV